MFTLAKQILSMCNTQSCFLIEPWSWQQDQNIDPLELRHDLSMCINPLSAPPPHKSQPGASVIPALEVLINAPSVVELKGLDVEKTGN